MEPEIVFRTDDEDAAFAKEMELIALYGRGTRGTLLNRTDGGEGSRTSQRAIIWKEVQRLLKEDRAALHEYLIRIGLEEPVIFASFLCKLLPSRKY